MQAVPLRADGSHGELATSRVVGLSRGDCDVRAVRTDKHGRFVFDGVAASAWNVYAAEALLNPGSVTREPYRGALGSDWRHPTNCNVRDGETTTLWIELERFELREFQLSVRLDGRPAPRWTRRLPSRSGPERSSVTPRSPSPWPRWGCSTAAGLRGVACRSTAPAAFAARAHSQLAAPSCAATCRRLRARLGGSSRCSSSKSSRARPAKSRCADPTPLSAWKVT